MATAFQPPHIVAQQRKEEDLVRRMNSIGPVTRSKARDEYFDGVGEKFAEGLVRQAEENAEAYKQAAQWKWQDKYKPLPKGANILKD